LLVGWKEVKQFDKKRNQNIYFKRKKKLDIILHMLRKKSTLTACAPYFPVNPISILLKCFIKSPFHTQILGQVGGNMTKPKSRQSR
jgi:hypothetical protein